MREIGLEMREIEVQYGYFFPHPQNVIRDFVLALFVLGLIVIDLFILITYTAIVGAKGELGVKLVSNMENPEDIIGVRYSTIIEDSIFNYKVYASKMLNSFIYQLC